MNGATSNDPMQCVKPLSVTLAETDNVAGQNSIFSKFGPGLTLNTCSAATSTKEFGVAGTCATQHEMAQDLCCLDSYFTQVPGAHLDIFCKVDGLATLRRESHLKCLT